MFGARQTVTREILEAEPTPTGFGICPKRGRRGGEGDRNDAQGALSRVYLDVKHAGAGSDPRGDEHHAVVREHSQGGQDGGLLASILRTHHHGTMQALLLYWA